MCKEGNEVSIPFGWLEEDPKAALGMEMPHLGLGFFGYRGEDGSTPVDECLVNEILWLNAMGIETKFCCCGHGEPLNSYLIVSDRDIFKMLALGYVWDERDMPSFYPRGVVGNLNWSSYDNKEVANG